MGKLHIGELSELAAKICELNKQMLTLIDIGERVHTLEQEGFKVVTEEEFNALTPEELANNNYAVIEE